MSEPTDNLAALPVWALMDIVKRDWPKPYFGAVPYIDALQGMEAFHDIYGDEDGYGLAMYFLSNATRWRGPIARAVKAELNRRLQARP